MGASISPRGYCFQQEQAWFKKSKQKAPNENNDI